MNDHREYLIERMLTPFAVTTRYPGLDEDVSKSEAESAIDTARMVKHVVRKSLLNQGVVM